MIEVIRSTGKVRMNYIRGAFGEREMRGRGPRPAVYHGKVFDRWCAEVERAAAEKAWSVGHAAGQDYRADGWNSDAHDPEEDNPYRAAALGLTAGQEREKK